MVAIEMQDGHEATWTSGKLSAWLHKRKSGHSVMRVRRYNKRFFTLDFDHKVFFYAHSANSKNVRSLISFSDIMDVTTIPVPNTPPAESRRPSLARRLSLTSLTSNSSTKNTAKDGIIVRSKGRLMELVCSSPMEAAEWYQAFQSVLHSANSGTFDCSGKQDLSELETTVGTNSERQLTHTEEDASPHPGSPANGSPEADADQACEDKPPPAQRGMLFDLDADLDGDEAGVCDQGEVEAVEERPNTFQATDLGFEIDESDSDSDCSVASSAGCEKEQPKLDGSASPRSQVSDKESPSKPCHGDRHEGLTLQERLAALEFSDDEDEDDNDPLGLATMGEADTDEPDDVTAKPFALPSLPPADSEPDASLKPLSIGLASLPASPPMAPDDDVILTSTQVLASEEEDAQQEVHEK